MFWKNHSYNFVRMLINQIAIGLLGLVLYFTASHMKNELMKLLFGIGSSAFFLFMVYTTAWDIGSKEFAPVSSGRKQAKPLTGFYITLVSYIPVMLSALILIFLHFLSDNTVLQYLGSVAALLESILEGMYLGIISYGLGEGESIWIYWYLILILPGCVVGGIAYYLGMKGIRLTSLNTEQYPKSDRPTKAEMQELKKRNQMKQKECPAAHRKNQNFNDEENHHDQS